MMIDVCIDVVIFSHNANNYFGRWLNVSSPQSSICICYLGRRKSPMLCNIGRLQRVQDWSWASFRKGESSHSTGWLAATLNPYTVQCDHNPCDKVHRAERHSMRCSSRFGCGCTVSSHRNSRMENKTRRDDSGGKKSNNMQSR